MAITGGTMEFIFFFIGLIVFLIVIELAIKFWYITLALGAIGVVIYLIVKPIVKEKRRQAEEAERKAAEEAQIRKHKEEQNGYQEQLIVLSDDSITLFEKMPKHLKTAEEHLNQAEFEFSEGAFAPFWDAIEKTAKALGRFDERVQSIRNNSSQYTSVAKKYEGVPPHFPLSRKSVEKLSVGTSTAERMKEIVRTAQRNFQFATIYEQRKTNQILVAGFTNLAQALDRMTWQITESIDNLAGSVDSMALTLSESMGAIHSRLGDMADANIKQNSEMANLESARVERERMALQMLDNIQHHRKPTIEGIKYYK